MIMDNCEVKTLFIVAISGFLGNVMDSVLGASVQQTGWVNNHGVNFLNTLFAALFAGGLYLVIS